MFAQTCGVPVGGLGDVNGDGVGVAGFGPGVPVGEGEATGLGKRDGEGITEGDGVGITDGDGEGVGEGLPVGDGDGVLGGRLGEGSGDGLGGKTAVTVNCSMVLSSSFGGLLLKTIDFEFCESKVNVISPGAVGFRKIRTKGVSELVANGAETVLGRNAICADILSVLELTIGLPNPVPGMTSNSKSEITSEVTSKVSCTPLV